MGFKLSAKNLFLETEQNKTADKQRFNFIYIIRLPQNSPQAYV
jgi:hypothetical protein